MPLQAKSLALMVLLVVLMDLYFCLLGLSMILEFEIGEWGFVEMGYFLVIFWRSLNAVS